MKKIDIRKCAKQTVVALLITEDNDYFVGSNWCRYPRATCPRGDMESGEGYDLCKAVCMQDHHAEVDACKKAGTKAKGATIYLIGHTYCCDKCKMVMEEAEIANIIILG